MLDLEAIELIKQLKARYFRFLDTANMKGLKQTFTDDAEINFNSPSYQLNFKGWSDIEAFYKKSFTSRSFGMHNGHMPEISVDGDNATGLWYLHDIFIHLDSKVQFEGSAIYEDTYVKIDGQWKIKTSGYKRLFEKITPLDDSTKITAQPI